MEKYAVTNDHLNSALRDEEHKLMLEMADHMSDSQKTACDDGYTSLQARLQQVRDKITAIDLKQE